MKIAVIGAGKMGRAAVYDLAHNPDVDAVGVYDIDAPTARLVARKYGRRNTVAGRFDAGDVKRAVALFKNYDAVISAVTYRHNPGLAKAAIAAGAHFFDLGGNNDAVAAEFKLDMAAKRAGVVVIPDCGLAPGMVSIIGAGDIARFDKPRSLSIRVGGLPQKPHPPLDYQILFSSEGLINEYYEPAVVLRNGRAMAVESLTDLETLTFAGLGTFEAFNTSGGTSTLPTTYKGVLKNLDYKTIRYPGHCLRFKTMMDIGLASWEKLAVEGVRIAPRNVLKAVLDKNLSYDEPDLSLVRITTEGQVGGKRKRLVSEIVDRYDRRTGLTSMMRCTAFPVTIIAAMAASGRIPMRGVVVQEKAVDPAIFEKELAKRRIIIRRRWSRG